MILSKDANQADWHEATISASYVIQIIPPTLVSTVGVVRSPRLGYQIN